MTTLKMKKTPQNENGRRGEERWIVKVWRPAMAWSYMAICLFDFIIAPTGTAFLVTFYHSSIGPWQSLTLSNGGLMHIAFGAIIGVSAWGRTRENVIRTEMGAYGGYGNHYGGSGFQRYERDEMYVGEQRSSRQPQVSRRQRQGEIDSDIQDNMHEADRDK